MSDSKIQPMNIFHLLAANGVEVTPKSCKFHFARSPLQREKESFQTREGFKTFQETQSSNNFLRDYVISFYEYGEGLWLFAGVWKILSKPTQKTSQDGKPLFLYKTQFLQASECLERRLVVEWPKRFRQSYPNGETIAEVLKLHAVMQSPDELGKFPGFAKVRLTFSAIKRIVNDPVTSVNWKTALESVAGVYVITDDMSGKLYVDSAYGKENIWQRWTTYASTGHGNNVELKKLSHTRGKNCFENFIFTLIWHADSASSKEDVLEMESYWKDSLLTRSFGYNKN